MHRAVAVVGSRDLPAECRVLVHNFIALLPHNAVVISGGARGVDSWAAESAIARGLRVVVYPADWKKHGQRAGFIRNTQIVEDCTELVAFWDGKALAALTGDDRAEAAIGNLVRDRRLQIKRAEKAEAERDEAREQKAQLAREFMRDEVAKLEARIEAAYVERDKARATVSGLVEAVTRWRDAPWSCSCDNCAACAEQADSKDALDAALASTATLASRTRAAIRAEALEEAAKACEGVRYPFAFPRETPSRIAERCAAKVRELAAKERGRPTPPEK